MANDMRIPDYYPGPQDWRWCYQNHRKPVFDLSKTGERLDQTDTDPNVELALDGQPETEE